MSQYLHRAIEHINSAYGGQAARIWQDQPSSAELVFRFLQFPAGIGPKIATMAANIPLGSISLVNFPRKDNGGLATVD